MKAFTVFSGNANIDLAREIAKELGTKLGKLSIENFPDKETYVRVESNVKNKNVFIVQPTSEPANDHMIELLLIADAAERAGAKKIIAIIPYYGYARQDRVVKDGEPVSAELFARLLRKSGVDHIIAMDLHSKAVERFLKPDTHLHALPKIRSRLERNKPEINLRALPVIAEYIKRQKIKDLVVVSPDAGALKNAKEQARVLGAGVALITKKRISGSKVKAQSIEGNISGKNCVIIDDIISTAGTMSEAIKMLKRHGAKNVYIAATHGVLVGKAIQRLRKVPVKEVIVTNTIPQKEHKKLLPKLKVLSVAPFIARVLKKTY